MVPVQVVRMMVLLVAVMTNVTNCQETELMELVVMMVMVIGTDTITMANIWNMLHSTQSLSTCTASF